jgi:hypothetical protein
MAATNRVHYFHADASGLGGTLERPVEQLIPLQAPLSLSPSGGYGSARSENFGLEQVLSFQTAYTQVAGSLSKKTGRGWVTLTTSVVEGLNVLDVVTADRVVAQISTEHPLEGYDPTVTFLGTQFENLKIGGKPVEVILDLNICDQAKEGTYPNGPCIGDKRFLARVGEQYSSMANPENLPPWVADKTIPSWLQQRYQWDNSQVARKGTVICSVVKGTTGEFGGRPFGHVLEVPDFGKVFLGELIVDSGSYQLVMVRLELGCLADGSASFAAAKSNGRTEP